MKYCTTCVLPDTFPGITFDEKGVCRFCREEQGIQDTLEKEKQKVYHAFIELIDSVRDTHEYDCTLSYSGGKDSTYTLYLLKQEFKLRVLALVFDNGFISDQAMINIRAVTEHLGVDCLIVKPDFNVLQRIFRYAAGHAMYATKALERASTICTSCIGLVKFSFLKTAIEKQIPVMAWGWSPGQAPLRSSLMRMNPKFFKAAQEVLIKPMRQAAGNAVDAYFLNETHFKSLFFPYSVSPLAFMRYHEEDILAKVQMLGWRAPRDVDANSTNCLLNSFANHLHLQQHGFHPYAFEIAGMVRMGIMSRAEGMKKITEAGSSETIRYAQQKLGLEEEIK